MEFSKFLKNFDKIGYKPKLLYKKESKYKTTLGAIFSIIFYVAIIYIVTTYLINFLSSKNTSVIYNKFPYAFNIFNSMDSDIESRSNINNHNFYKNETKKSFMIIFRLVGDDYSYDYKNKNETSLESKLLINASFEVFNKFTKLTNIIKLPLINCNMKNFKNYYCIDSYLFTNISSYNEIKIKISNLNYTSQGVLEDINNEKNNFDRKLNFYLQVYFPIKMINTYAFDFKNNSEDFKFYFKELLIPLNSFESKNINSVFLPIYYRIDRGNFITKYEDYNIDYNYEYQLEDTTFFQSNKIDRESASEKKLYENLINKNLVELTISLSDLYIIYRISYCDKFINIFTNLAFTLLFFYNFLKYVIRKINKKIFYSELFLNCEEDNLPINKNNNSQYIQNFSSSLKSREKSENINIQNIFELGKSQSSPIKNNNNCSISNTIIYSNLKEKDKNFKHVPNLKEINLNLCRNSIPDMSLDNSLKLENFNDSKMDLNTNSMNINENKVENQNDKLNNKNKFITDFATAIKFDIQKSKNQNQIYKQPKIKINDKLNIPFSKEYKDSTDSNKEIKFSFANSGRNLHNLNKENKILENSSLNFQQILPPSLSPKIDSFDNKNHGILIYKYKNFNAIKNNTLEKNQIKELKSNSNFTSLICNFYICVKKNIGFKHICYNKYSDNPIVKDQVLSVISIESLVKKIYIFENFLRNHSEISKIEKD